MSGLIQGGKGLIVPGKRTVEVISTEHSGGIAEKLLRAIACSFEGTRIQRNFRAPWTKWKKAWTIHGMVVYREKKTFPLCLKIGCLDYEGLIVREVDGVRYSSKPIHGQKIIEVGRDMPFSRIPGFAHMLVAEWIVHAALAAE